MLCVCSVCVVFVWCVRGLCVSCVCGVCGECVVCVFIVCGVCVWFVCVVCVCVVCVWCVWCVCGVCVCGMCLCVCVALSIPHAISTGHIVICGLSGSTIHFSLSHIRHDFQKGVTEYKICVLMLSTIFV